MRKTYLILCMAAVMALLTSCGSGSKKDPTSTTKGSFEMMCDDSFENIMEQEIDVYEYIYPKAKVLCRYGTESEVVDSFLKLSYRTIVIPRALTDAEVAQIKAKKRVVRQNQIAVDAVALIINPENPADKVSLQEVSEILSGETTTWNELNPHWPDKQIAILLDKPGSAMASFMRDSLLNGKKFADNVYAQGSIKGVIDAVKADKYAIGVIGVSWLTSDLKSFETIDSIAVDVQDPTKAADMGVINDKLSNSGVKVLGVMRNDDPTAYRPFQQNIYDGTYPLTRQIWMATVSPGGSPASGFYSFVTGTDGQKLIMKTGVMPARMQINVVELVP